MYTVTHLNQFIFCKVSKYQTIVNQQTSRASARNTVCISDDDVLLQESVDRTQLAFLRISKMKIIGVWSSTKYTVNKTCGQSCAPEMPDMILITMSLGLPCHLA